MATVTVRQSITKDGVTLSQDVDVQGSYEEIDETVAGEATDSEIDYALDVSACKLFWIESDQPCTVETNSGSAADNSLTLAADEPYLWYDGCGATFVLDTDVTSLFVTVPGTTGANIKIRHLRDATPS